MANFGRLVTASVLILGVYGGRPSKAKFGQAALLELEDTQFQAMLTEELEEPCAFAKKYASSWKAAPFDSIQNQIATLSTSCTDKERAETLIPKLKDIIATQEEKIAVAEKERAESEADKAKFTTEHPDRSDEMCSEHKDYLFSVKNKAKRAGSSSWSSTKSTFGYLGSKMGIVSKEKYAEAEANRTATKAAHQKTYATKLDYWNDNCKPYNAIVAKIKGANSVLDKETKVKETKEGELKDSEEKLATALKSIGDSQTAIPEAMEELRKTIAEELSSKPEASDAAPANAEETIVHYTKEE